MYQEPVVKVKKNTVEKGDLTINCIRVYVTNIEKNKVRPITYTTIPDK